MCYFEPSSHLLELVQQVRNRNWESVWIADDSAAFTDWYQLFNLFGDMKFANLFRREVLADMQVSGQKQYLEQLAAQLTQRLSFAEIEQWLDANVQLMPGLREFVEVLPPTQGLVIVADNFEPFVQRILLHHGLNLPFIANKLHQNGTVETVSGNDGHGKENVSHELLLADIWVNGVVGTVRTIKGSVARFAYDLEVPAVCLTRLTRRRRHDIKYLRYGTPSMQRLRVTDSWKGFIDLQHAEEHAS